MRREKLQAHCMGMEPMHL